MANLTKKVLGLAGTAMVFAGMSFGQNFTNNCGNPIIAGGGSPILDRFEGTTELVADMFIACQPIGGTPLSNAAIKLQMSLPITSPVLDKAGDTDAVVRITDTATNTTQVIQGVGVSGSSTQITFSGVNFPAADPFTITFSNIRVNASMAANGTSNIPVTESFFILNLGQEVSYTPTPLNVGFVQTGFSTPLLTTKLAAQYVICTGNPTTGLQLTNIPANGGTASFAISQQTLFGGALKSQTPGQGYGTGAPGPSLTNGEAGSYVTTTLGLATHGTRIQLAFSGVNAGETIYLPNTIVPTVPDSTGKPVADTNVQLQLTINGTGKAFSGEPAGSVLTAGALAGTVPFTADANGNITATYEATMADSTKQNETYTFLGWITAKPNFSPTSVSAITVNVGLAPQAGATVTDVPAFSNSYPSITLSPFNLCQTTLLFPFVSAGTAAAPGFDTGIAISNTGMDPYPTGTGASGTPGTCTFNLYSTLASSTPPTSAAVATSLAALNGSGYPANGIIPPGATVAFSLANENIAPGFTGYIIAQCQFLYAHGFAYITYGSDSPVTVNSEMAMGYLAEVLQNNRANIGAGPEGGVTF
jgi:hypothetical protein